MTLSSTKRPQVSFAFREYLKGFQKRKQERRERAQKDLEDEIKTDLKNLRQKVMFYNEAIDIYVLFDI